MEVIPPETYDPLFNFSLPLDCFPARAREPISGSDSRPN